jgi:hypothetical protein
MRGSGDRPIAYVDESLSANRSLYTVTGVIVAPGAAWSIRRGLEELAGQHDASGRAYFHAHHADERARARVTSYLANHPGVRTIVTVRAPVEPGRTETARQQCLAELAGRVAQAGVRSMVLDDRWPGHIAGSAQQKQNDQQTVDACRRAGLVPQEFLVRHADDRQQPLLWAADTLGWQVRRSIEHDEPARLAPLSEKLQVVEARLVVSRERGDDQGRIPRSARAPSTGLQARLDLLMAKAGHTSAQQSVARELHKPVDPGRTEALKEAKEKLARAEKRVQEAKEGARATPGLEKYTRREGSDRPGRSKSQER